MNILRYARIAQIVGLLGFVLPWATVSCSGQKVASLSGLNLALGRAVIRDPISGESSLHIAGPAVSVCAALAILVIGLLVSLLIARRTAAKFNVIGATAALALIIYEAFLSDNLSESGQSPITAAILGRIEIRTAIGLWITGLALATWISLEHVISGKTDLPTKPSRWSRAVGVAGIVALIVLPVSTALSKANTHPQQSDANAAPDPHPRESADRTLSIEPLSNPDRARFAGAACWTTNEHGQIVMISDGHATMRVNGQPITLAEVEGRIGGNVLHSADGRLTVTFRERAGKTITAEEAVSRPMMLTLFDGDSEKSLSVVRSCGA